MKKSSNWLAGGLALLTLGMMHEAVAQTLAWDSTASAAYTNGWQAGDAGGTDGATSGTRDMSFSTLHLANYTSSYAVNYDEIRLGTTLADVSAIPEPATLGLVAFFGTSVLFIRRWLSI